MGNGLHGLDFLVIAIYALAMLALGCIAAVANDRSTNISWVAGRATRFSSASRSSRRSSHHHLLVESGEIIRNGPYFMTTIVAAPIAYLIVGYFLIPIYMRQRVTSAYELLEVKLGLGTRLMGASMFIALRYGMDGGVAELRGQSFSGHDRGRYAMGWSRRQRLSAASLCSTPRSVGCERFVITDFVQSILLFGGALLVVIIVTWQLAD